MLRYDYELFDLLVMVVSVYIFQKKTWEQTILLSFQIVGVVYGQLSTAPLYVFGTIQARGLVQEEVVYELFSFIFWTLTIIALLKYAVIVLRADDEGEGNYPYQPQTEIL